MKLLSRFLDHARFQRGERTSVRGRRSTYTQLSYAAENTMPFASYRERSNIPSYIYYVDKLSSSVADVMAAFTNCATASYRGRHTRSLANDSRFLYRAETKRETRNVGEVEIQMKIIRVKREKERESCDPLFSIISHAASATTRDCYRFPRDLRAL